MESKEEARAARKAQNLVGTTRVVTGCGGWCELVCLSETLLAKEMVACEGEIEG